MGQNHGKEKEYTAHDDNRLTWDVLLIGTFYHHYDNLSNVEVKSHNS